METITNCEKYAETYNFEFISINKYNDTYRVNFKEYDGDGYIIHKIKIEKLLSNLSPNKENVNNG